MKTLVETIFWIGLAWLAVAVMIFLACGCSPINSPLPVTDLPVIGQGLTRIEGDATDAKAHVQRATPHADPIGKTELTGANDSLTDLLLELADTEIAYASVTKQVEALGRSNFTLVHDLEAERDHWLGYKTRQLIFWLCLVVGLGWVSIGLAGMLLKGFGGGTMFAVGQQILRALPLANLFSAGANKIMEVRSVPITQPVTVNVNVPK